MSDMSLNSFEVTVSFKLHESPSKTQIESGILFSIIFFISSSTYVIPAVPASETQFLNVSEIFSLWETANA